VKGFPNQIVDLGKLSQSLRCIVELLDAGQNPRDDGVLGMALVRAGVLGTDRKKTPVEKYIQVQSAKPPSNQSFRTSARGLRELYRLLGLIDDTGATVVVTPEGHQAAASGDDQPGSEQIKVWRRQILNFSHQGEDATASHPYQVLLRLVARKPGITRAKCALALEARDDSQKELERIVKLANLPEERIRSKIGVSQPNWDNAKKLIPSFAEQLGDVIKIGQKFYLAESPGVGRVVDGPSKPPGRAGARVPGTARTSRTVTPDTIGLAGMAERKEPSVPPNLDPAAAVEANRLRGERLRRHNLLVRALAGRLWAKGMALDEDPFDILAVRESVGILGEIKTLDGSADDERERVREALAQLLYYEAFAIRPSGSGAAIHKVACFERPISGDHQSWLNKSGIATIWKVDDRFAGDALAANTLGRYLEELR
jgi:hypothetical protein